MLAPKVYNMFIKPAENHRSWIHRHTLRWMCVLGFVLASAWACSDDSSGEGEVADTGSGELSDIPILEVGLGSGNLPSNGASNGAADIWRSGSHGVSPRAVYWFWPR